MGEINFEGSNRDRATNESGNCQAASILDLAWIKSKPYTDT
jgi:hypothetical protein